MAYNKCKWDGAISSDMEDVVKRPSLVTLFFLG